MMEGENSIPVHSICELEKPMMLDWKPWYEVKKLGYMVTR
jgi:hypothetical protein